MAHFLFTYLLGSDNKHPNEQTQTKKNKLEAQDAAGHNVDHTSPALSVHSHHPQQ